jgi:hypothetical protein
MSGCVRRGMRRRHCSDRYLTMRSKSLHAGPARRTARRQHDQNGRSMSALPLHHGLIPDVTGNAVSPAGQDVFGHLPGVSRSSRASSEAYHVCPCEVRICRRLSSSEMPVNDVVPPTATLCSPRSGGPRRRIRGVKVRAPQPSTSARRPGGYAAAGAFHLAATRMHSGERLASR